MGSGAIPEILQWQWISPTLSPWRQQRSTSTHRKTFTARAGLRLHHSESLSTCPHIFHINQKSWYGEMESNTFFPKQWVRHPFLNSQCIQEFSSQRGNRSFIPKKNLAGRKVAHFVGVVQRWLTSGKVWWQPWDLWPQWERCHRLQSIDHSWLLDRHCLQHWQSRPRMPGQGGSYLQQVRHQNALS